MIKHSQQLQNKLHKLHMTHFVCRQGIRRPLFWSPFRPSPLPPPRTQPPGERALPARRPAASLQKDHLNFKTVSPIANHEIHGAVRQWTASNATHVWRG